MKILILNPILYTADNNTIPKVKSIKDTMIYNMCLGFKSLGYEVTLAAAADYMPVEFEEYDFDMKWLKTDCHKLCPPSVLPYSKELSTFLKENSARFDMIVTSEVFSLWSFAAACICPNKTIIWQELTEHQNKFHQLPSKFWHHVVAKFFMQKVKAVVPRSTKAYDFIHQFMPMTTKKVVDHGINVDKFQYSTIKKRQIISSSQLIHRKNVDGIIHIFADFHHQKGYEDIKLLIAGRGEEEMRLKKLVSMLGLNDSVEFLGFLPQAKLNEYIRESLCFLVNTRKDLNMVSIPESIVSGTPILTNLQPASAGYIAKEHLGIAKDSWGVDELKQMIDNDSLFVDNCIKYRDKLTSKHSSKMLVDIFEKPKNYFLCND